VALECREQGFERLVTPVFGDRVDRWRVAGIRPPLEADKRVRKRELLICLLYDQTDLKKRETEAVVDELEAVVERYGYDDLRGGDGA